MRAQLAHGAAQVAFHGLARDTKLLGDLAVAAARRGQGEDVELAGSEPGRWGGALSGPYQPGETLAAGEDGRPQRGIVDLPGQGTQVVEDRRELGRGASGQRDVVVPR